MFKYTYGPLHIEPYCVITGHLGQPLIAFDDSASVGWKTWYKPFGETAGLQQPDLTLNFRLPGQYYDAETGLYYNWHRYYMPGIGRYLQADPLTAGRCSSSLKSFLYATNNPLRYTDVSGLMTCKEMIGCIKKSKSGCDPDAKSLWDRFDSMGGTIYCRPGLRTGSCGSMFWRESDRFWADIYNVTIPSMVSWDVKCDGDPCETFFHELAHVLEKTSNEDVANAKGKEWNDRMRSRCNKRPDENGDDDDDEESDGSC